MTSTFLNKIKPLFFYLWFIAVVSGIMVCILSAAYTIPTERMKENIDKYPITAIEQDSMFSVNFYGLPIDGFTDALILNNVIFKHRNFFRSALLNPRVQIHYLDIIDNLQIAIHPYRAKYLEFIYDV